MAETAVMVTIATAMASGLLKDVTLRGIGAVCETSAIGGLISALFGGLKSDLQLLDRELSILQALLRAERLYPAQCSDATTNVLVLAWLRTVEDAAYYADNLFDEMSLRKIRLKVDNRVSRGGFGESFDACAFRMRIAGKVKKFLNMTRKIDEEAGRIGIKPVELLVSDQMYQPSPSAICAEFEDVRAYVVASDVVGRDQDEELIVNKLCCADDDLELSVITIVGMSGIGKTTLARSAYYNKKVVGHFPKRLWISVSDNFELRRILNEMVESVTNSSSNLSNIDGIEDTLHSCLKDKRFLVVLDDVQHVNAEIWRFMKDLHLLQRVGGSVLPQVLVATQNDEVVSAMNTSSAHVLERLCESDSWGLFERDAFANKSPEQKSNLKTVGERIFRKCNGVPLAIKALGSLLKSKDKKQEWEAVESNQVWGLNFGDMKDVVMPSLLLSFNNLSSESAKRCFTYCAVILPKGFSATEMTLVQLWMAHGFLQQSRLKTMEDHGKEIMKVLMHRYLLQVDKCDSFGEVISYRMHDLMHGLALYISKGTCLVVKYLDELTNTSATKHLCITKKNMHALTNHASRFSVPKLKLWSLFSFSRMDVTEDVIKYLRVLSLTCGLTEIPASVGRLKHLRYLDLSKNLFKVLPDSIGDVGHLQTLKLKHCGSLTKLPVHITKLINLRHLSTTKHVALPVEFGHLTYLQELPMVNLQAEGLKIDELGCLLNIGGVLSIKGVEHMKGKEDARQSKLLMMPKISQLELIWNRERSDEGGHGNDLAVIDGLQPHSNLRDLLVKNYYGERLPPWIATSFPSLRVLSLLNCNRCELLPKLGHLPSLEILIVSGMTSLEEIDDNGIEGRILFPRLKELTFQKMRNLQHWSGPPELAFPRLEVLEIKDCPKLITAPTHFTSLEKLSFNGVKSGKPLEMILSNNRSLTSLTVQDIQLLTSLTKELLHCTSLQQIQVSSCKELTDFPNTLQTLHSLETLQVEDCDSVTSLPDMTSIFSLTRLVIRNCINLRHPPTGLNTCTSIQTLAFSGCQNFDFFPNLASLSRLEKLVLRTFTKQMVIPNWLSNMTHLRSLDIGDLAKELDVFPDISPLQVSLRSLYIVGWSKIQSLPSQFCKFTRLERLALFSFDAVEDLPESLCKLSSLQILRIRNCKNIKHLPPKDHMQCLDQLRLLDIKSCPLLKERCVKDRGVEWDKIAHLRRISIDNEDIQKPT